MSRQGLLVVYSGPSGVGKGTLLAPLITPGGPLTLSVSATTRTPRAGEIDGVHYHFVTRAHFEEMIAAGEMLEFACYNGNYYGTPRHFVEQLLNAGHDVVLEIEVQGAKQIKQLCPNALLIFVMPPSFYELRHRLESRGTEDAQQLAGRLSAALGEISHALHYDFIIVNDHLEEARAQLMDAVRAGHQLARYHKNLIEEVLHQC
ncbi:MAG: guanylate kinase [Oscillospiraceae bacterium]